jgi:hypothetical protein
MTAMLSYEIQCGMLRGRAEAASAGAAFRQMLSYVHPDLKFAPLVRWRAFPIPSTPETRRTYARLSVWHYQDPQSLEASP